MGDDGEMRLILIRHGQTPSNVRGLLDTAAPGPGLTELGWEQAAAVPDVLAGERVDVVFASNLIRTQQTARPLMTERDLPRVIRPGIREIEAGQLEMLGDRDSVEAYMTTIGQWWHDREVRMPGGESGSEVFARFDSVVDEAHSGGAETAVFFSHGAMIRAWAGGRASNVSLDFIAATPVRNTGVVVLEGEPRAGWEVLTWEGEAIGGEL
ncbi:MAG TPA: histidine phosphatase family protein, partial [Actinomycetaceae bacterium]|nr:histidine phosphatase family protein [Actinomycetaceae bacterium]